MSISEFLDHNYRHFNARETRDAARAYKSHVEAGGKMLMALAGAMSTAEIGITLAKMIRADKVHAISCTAANLEEDLFNLVAHRDYRMLPNYRDLSPRDEVELRDAGFNRVTDTCIPETVMRHLEKRLMTRWQAAAERREAKFPFEWMYDLLRSGELEPHYEIPPEHSWLVAACEKNIPVYSPGWEDSTLGNIFTARVIEGKIANHSPIKTGTEQMQHLVQWYLQHQQDSPIGFFQIGGGIAGDFAICAVPLIVQDLRKEIRLWSYFAQISDSVTSFGSYSGAVPNEKITWYKLAVDSKRFMINSDATVVAPLIFAYVLGE